MSFSKRAVRLDEKYLKRVRELPCSVCEGVPVEAHHSKSLAMGCGMGLKAPDRMAIPLCFTCHRLFHSLGTREWEKRFGAQREHVEKTQKLLG